MLGCIVVLGLIVAALPAWAATYHVGKTGCTGACSDSNDCTQAQNPAFARETINGGISCLNSGDTLVIRSGTYEECIGDTTAPVIPSGGSTVTMTTLRVAPGATIVQTAPTGCSGGAGLIEIDVNQFILFDGHNGSGIGWVVDGMIDASTVNSFGIGIVGNNVHLKHLEVKRCRTPIKLEGGGNNQLLGLNVHSAGQPVCPSPTGCHGIYVSAHNNTLDGVSTHDNDCFGVTLSVEGGAPEGNIVKNSRIYRNGCGALSQSANNLWVNNVFFHNGGTEGGGLETPAPVINNTFFENGLYGLRPVGGASQVVKNNISVGQSWDILEGTPVDADNNICSGTGISGTMGCTMAGSASGLFVNQPGEDFHLKTGAGAINTGTCLGGEAATDHDGVPRPQQGACDIGAYEYTDVAAVPTALEFVQQPTNTPEDQIMTPAVTVRVVDQFGVLFPSSAAVTLALGANPGGGTLTGTTTQNAVGGVATFANLTLTQPGAGKTLVATSSGLTAATSTPFTITASAPVATALEFVQQPTNTVEDQVITPAVTVRVVDQFGSPFSSTALVTLAIGTNPGGSTLGGDPTQNVAGLTPATFADLTLNNPGTGYTLVATSPGLAAATSAPFTVPATGVPSTALVFSTISTFHFP